MRKSDDGTTELLLIKHAREALDVPHFPEVCEMLRINGKSLERFAHRCEACDCHEHIWKSRHAWGTKKRVLEQETGFRVCPMKGRTAAWIQREGIDRLIFDVRNSTSPTLQAMMTDMSAVGRGDLAGVQAGLQDSLIEELTSKLAFHQQCPYSCISIFQGELPGGTTEAARNAARKNIAEYDELIAAGKGNLLQRVAHGIYGRDTACRLELERFSVGDGVGLRSFPNAYVVLKRYALIPVVGRRVEEMHARMTRVARKLTYAKVPCIAASMRESDHVKQLEACPAFYKFIVSTWRSTSLLEDLLRLVLPKEELDPLSRKARIDRVYQCAIEDEYKDMSVARAGHAAFLRSTVHTRRKGFVPLPADWTLCVTMLKAKMDGQQLLSLPKVHFDDAAEASQQAAPPASRPSDEAIRLVLESPIGLTLSEESTKHLVFFSVVNAYPERRSYVQLHHVDRHNDRVVVSQRVVEAIDVEKQSAFLSVSETTTELKLHRLVANFADTLPALYTWELASKAGSMQVLRRHWPGPAQNLQPPRDDALYALPAPPMAGISEGLKTEVAVQSSQAEITKLMALQVMGEVHRCIDNVEAGWANFGDMLGISSEMVTAMIDAGGLEAKESEFGECMVRPCPSGLRWLPVFAAQRPMQVLHVDEFKDESKLDMALALLRRGWRPADGEEEWVVGGPSLFYVDLSRPASYFLCLLSCELLQSRGVSSIRHAAPDAYYQMLLRCKAAAIAEALRHGDWSQAFFQQQLKGLAPTHVDEGADDMLALADGSVGEQEGAPGLPAPVELAAPKEEQWRRCNVAGLGDDNFSDGCKVYFDHVHHSGRSRGYVACQHHAAEDCVHYVWCDDFPSRLALCAHLFEWAKLGRRCSSKSEHLLSRPSEAAVSTARGAIFVSDF